MKKRITRIVSMTMASALLISCAGYAALRQQPITASAQTEDDAADRIIDEIKSSVTFSDDIVDKEETVYIITDANGNVTKKIVSDHLINKDGSETLSDKSDLNEIENVKTDAGYKMGDDGDIEWDADGEDIYYQGTTDKELPVDVAVTYYLDGNEISAGELAGRSGRVTIRFDYTNNAKAKALVGSEEVEMYVPFTMISGVILPSENFSNIQVSSGKVIAEGKSNIVVGYAFPGLKDDLNITSDSSDIDLPDYVEITADVTDFSLLTTVTVGSADLLSSVEVDTAKTREDIGSVIDELVSSVNQLKDGSGQLSDGTNELKTSFVDYKDAIVKVIDAIGQLSDGATELDSNMGLIVDGAKLILSGVNELGAAFEGDNGAVSGAKQIADGISELDKGLDNLTDSVGDENRTQTIVGAVNALTAGAKQLSESVGSTDSKTVAKDAAKTTPSTVAGAVLALKNGAAQLDDGISQLQDGVNGTDKTVGLVDGISQIKAAVGSPDAKSIAADAANNSPSTLTGGATAVDEGVSQLVKGITDMSANLETSIAENNSNIETLTAAVNAVNAYHINPQTGQELTQEQEAALIADYTAKINQLYGANAALESVAGQMQQSQLMEGLTQLKGGTQSLKNGTITLAKSLDTLSDGAASLQSGITTLKAGSSVLLKGLETLNSKMSDLTSGAGTLANSLAALNSKMPQLKDGVEQLKEGSERLSAGSGELAAGISKIYSAIKSDLKSGASDLYDGTVSFQGYLDILADGAKELNSNTSALMEGTGQLSDGIDKLADGAAQLDDGVAQLKDASDKVTDSYENEIIPAMDRIEGTLEAAKTYNIFTQTAQGKTSSVKFIYRTGSIE